MLEIQKWLIQNRFNYDLLNEQMGIKTNFHPDGRVILNYDQIASYKFKTNEIVRECRGLVLDSEANLIARGFRRFFNLNEIEEEFDWSNFHTFEKVDGSLVLIYFWNGEFHINTRNSYSTATINDHEITWRELIESALPKNYKEIFNPQYCYIGEICSRYNKIVRDYPTTTFFLLSIFHGQDELSVEDYLLHAKTVNLKLSPTLPMSSKEDVLNFLQEKEISDPTFEGCVLRDQYNNRLKTKSKSYVRLHHIFSTGEPKTEVLIEIILKGEEGEVLTFWPEYTSRIEQIKKNYSKLFKEVENLWYCFHDEDNRKRFALSVKDHPMSSVLFQLKDGKGEVKELFDRLIIKKPELLEKK